MRPRRELLEPTGPRSFDVVCAGEALWHLVAPPGALSSEDSPLRFRPGGGAVSVAVAIARRGLHVGLATSLADDTFGRTLRSKVARAGVDIGGVALVPPRAGLVVLEGRGATRPVVSYRDEEQPAVIPSQWSSQVLLLSGLSPVIVNAASFCKAARAARRAGTIVVVDVNARWHVWAGRDARAIRMVLREADVVHCSTEDVRALGMDVRAMRDAMRARAVLVVSHGEGEAWITGPFGEAGLPPPETAAFLPSRPSDAFAVAVCVELARAGQASETRGDVWERVLRSGRTAPLRSPDRASRSA